ncbi:MAG: class I SAM-dependent methyltransferase [Oscillospiraceae bacterium]|nr:class I SAM-dependent methyltransferase [Oscillospiraceae bacterium]
MGDTKDLFNRRAAAWDKSHTNDPEKIELMLTLSDLRPGMDFLDVGCGTGVLAPYLLACDPGMVLAVDFAENMIEIAKEKVSDPRLTFLCTDVYALTSQAFDCCFLYNALPFFSEPDRLIGHLASLLRPGGRLSVSHSRGKAGESYIGQTLCGAPVHPVQGLAGLMRPYFHVDATIDNNALFFISGVLR